MSKKFIIPILVLFLSLTSCTETIVERYSTDNWKVIDVDIPVTSWNRCEDQYGMTYFEADIHVPEITKFVYTDGFVLGYNVDGNVQMPLPYVRHYDNGEQQWTSTLDFEYTPEYVHVFYTNSDFRYADGEPGYTTLRFVLQW